MRDAPGPDAAEAPVLLKEGAEFSGLLALDGPARIDGRLRGAVIGPGPLWIGPAADVEARVETDELYVAGRLAGEIRISRRLALDSSARVRGDLETPSLSLADGALLEGRCHAGAAAAEPADAAPPEAGSRPAPP
jgi:cytoskeletal protein CcmA (bactofilin family)